MADKFDAVLTLLHVSNDDLENLELHQVQDLLGALRCVTRQLEKEVVKREVHHTELSLAGV